MVTLCVNAATQRQSPWIGNWKTKDFAPNDSKNLAQFYPEFGDVLFRNMNTDLPQCHMQYADKTSVQ